MIEKPFCQNDLALDYAEGAEGVKGHKSLVDASDVPKTYLQNFGVGSRHTALLVSSLVTPNGLAYQL